MNTDIPVQLIFEIFEWHLQISAIFSKDQTFEMYFIIASAST